jgi:glycosyltransferase involved in cell wall biosynthesis
VSERKLRVLSIAHTAVSRSAGRLRYHPLRSHTDLDVHLVVPQRFRQFGRTLEADTGNDPGITVHILPIVFDSAGPMSWYLHIYPGLSKLIAALKPDVIHLWEEPWSAVASQACLFRKNAALVLEVDQNILKRLPPPFEFMRRRVLKQCDHILSRSGDATAVIRANGYTGPVSPIGYGVDQETFHPLSAAAEKTSSAPLALGYVGRLVEEKGIQDALEAMVRMRAPATLSIIGEGPYEPAIRSQIDRLGLGDRVSIRGWDKPDVVADFMRGLDALLLLTHTTPTVKEQFGRVIIEAQSCGTPVIGAHSGAIPDVVGDGGWIIPQHDPAALADLVDRLSEDRSEIGSCRQLAIKNVETRFTYGAIADQLATAWKAAAAHRASTLRAT